MLRTHRIFAPKRALALASIILFGTALGFSQTTAASPTVNLTAAPTTVTLPDGSAIPMWGYTCVAATGSTATCGALNPKATTGWSPVVITVPAAPSGTSLTINLTNSLSFSNGNAVPTSLTIVGQLGGGLGAPTTVASPPHANLGVSWSTTSPPSNATPPTSPTFTPPAQGPRVQSFATEVPAGKTATLNWSNLQPGTYLIESGTHPSIQGPMGLYGMLVVTAAPTAAVSGGAAAAPGTAYPGVTYDADVNLLMSEIDPVQNRAVSAAVNTAGFSETKVWSGQPGGCGNPASGAAYQTCYPPAVNYTPLYYLFNGVAFDKTNAGNSLFATASSDGQSTGSVLVRFVNAGLRMHVPSIVGSQTASTAPVGGFALIAEDGNPLPGLPRVQSEVFMAAGKTYDVLIGMSAAGATALPVYDRELSLSGGGSQRDAGMLAYLNIASKGISPSSPLFQAAVANADKYSVVPGNTLAVSDVSKGLIANDVNVYGVAVATAPANGTLTLNSNGTFSYVPTGTNWAGDTFTYLANNNPKITATVTLTAGTAESAAGITLGSITYTSKLATSIKIAGPGVLSNAIDGKGFPLTVVAGSVKPVSSGLSVNMSPDGGFSATVSTPGTYSFTYQAQNSQGTKSSTPGTATIIFPAGSGLAVTVKDGKNQSNTIADYRWIIEEDRTFYVDPNCSTNPPPAGCPSAGAGVVLTPGVNFHTSNMPFVAQGCTGPKSCESGQSVLGAPSVCDVGNGLCRPDTTGTGLTATLPSQAALDPTKRYYISVLPGDAADPFYGAGSIGHTMGGAPIAAGATAVTVLTEPTPLPPGKLTVLVFEDDYPVNGQQDGDGEVGTAPGIEPGLGGFQIHLWDAMGGNGDFTGQMTYDMFNMPLTNSLDGTIDPKTGQNACPISGAAQGITGMIITCPTYEADGKTFSPLAGQAVINNLMPGRFGVVATPGADRIGRGEEWLQTNTLDGQKAHDAFVRVGEPDYFQEYGPAGYHVTVGFANPAIINSRLAPLCKSAGTCQNTVTGQVTTSRMSRTPDERLYSSGSYDQFAFTQCYASIGDPTGEDFAFTKCDSKGNFTFAGIPNGTWKVSVFDKWNEMVIDGITTPVALTGSGASMGQIATNQWQSNLYTRTFLDSNQTGVWDSTKDGLGLIPVSVRYRDGSLANNLSTDFSGVANFNETFPLFNWYTVESDTTRYKTTGIHTVYDAGGPADGTDICGKPGYPKCGTSAAYNFMANTWEANPLPASLKVPGAVYCASADCSGDAILNGPSTGTTNSTGRIDPPWVAGGVEGWQGFLGNSDFVEFGKEPYVPGENGGIKGHVVYSSTRPFDDPQLLVQTQWEPLIPHVTINLYQEATAADGVTPTLTLVDTTQSSSWDDWAQGFRADGNPNMNCAGQDPNDLFIFSLNNQPNYLDWYNSQHNAGTSPTALPFASRYKCYDGMHNWNQLQPAPYDGLYQFPSVAAMDPTTGKPTKTNCTICQPNTAVAATDLYYGQPMLPAGKYVVEVVVPPGYELVKEEDKNILIGDNFIAPVTQQFSTLGDIFILPDQASVAANYNANNAQNSTTNLGASPTNQAVPSFPVEQVWACVGQSRIVPDYISLYPQSKQVAPFAGATRNLCDRKEVILGDQMGASAKFYLFTSTHIASKFTGQITDDYAGEFDPFSPQFGEKFAPPNLPVAVKDWTGAEVNRVYADHWGTYEGLNYSTWEVNPPNPTGYSPSMMTMCMNDRGTGAAPDPAYNPAYSQFCYELPYMPGQTAYLDTPVVPTTAFATGYNHPDCAYPDATPAIARVDGDGGSGGPWASKPGVTLTITALGDQSVQNYAYSGPQANTPPYNSKTTTRHYGFGSAQGTVTIGGMPAAVTGTGWSDTSIQVTVPAGMMPCPLQQQAIYGGSAAKCGQLVVTATNGRQTIDAITVTVGGKAPSYVVAGTSIQDAIDAAQPGDLVIVQPGTYSEMLLMWKPVRLQGVGAASVIVDGNPLQGKLDIWRNRVTCLFGLATNGQPISGKNPAATCPASQQGQVDALPTEAILGWDTTANANVAELLIEPTLMGAYEGAAITVLAKGVDYHGGNQYATAGFPAGTTYLTANTCLEKKGSKNPFPSNFQCNPSSIDGLGITDSSQGGGGVFVHGWAHNLQIANNRIYNNAATISGGITVGEVEFPEPYLKGSATNDVPGSCLTGAATQGIPANAQLPFCYNMNVNVHNNSISLNSSLGEGLGTGTQAGVGGASFGSGADYYVFTNNWVCGNEGIGDGGGIGHTGFSYNGDIEHNTVLFNESTNPTTTTNGGGILVSGAPALSYGTGPDLVINANLVMGNSATSGSGGGIRLENVNGTDVTTFPKDPAQWNKVTITNNLISNNVAGWDGGGVSLQDALYVDFINNTVMSNNSTASAGVLFNNLEGATGVVPGNLTQSNTSSSPQVAGFVSIPNSPALLAGLNGQKLNCPQYHAGCASFSNPYLVNDLFWQNGSYFINVGAEAAQYNQHVVALYNAFTTNQAAPQPNTDSTTADGNGVVVTGGTGACVASNASYWDIGVRGDKTPQTKESTYRLVPTYSVLTDAGDYPNAFNLASDPAVLSQYCNGSRTPPEYAAGGWQVPPGSNFSTAIPTQFSLTPTATADEGNNWINLQWGPLTLTNPVTNQVLGNYAPSPNSPAISYVPVAITHPAKDFYGNPRPNPATPKKFDVGAVQFETPARVQIYTVSPNTGARGKVVNVTITGIGFTGATAVEVTGGGVTIGALTVTGDTTITTTFTIGTGAALTQRTVTVVSPLGTSTPAIFTVTGPGLSSITPTAGLAGLSYPVTISGTDLTGTSQIIVSGTGITVNKLKVVNDTTVTATFVVAPSATQTTRTVDLLTPNGNTVAGGSVFFAVQPSLTAIAPGSGTPGNPVAVTLTGPNLTGATGINISGGNGVSLVAGSFKAVDANTVTATFMVAAGANVSTVKNISVNLPNGVTTNSVTFTVVNAPPPTLGSVSPATATHLAKGSLTVPVTLSGVNFTAAGTTVAVSGGGISVQVGSVHYVSATSITANLVVQGGQNAVVGAKTLTVTTPGGTSNTAMFTVQ